MLWIDDWITFRQLFLVKDYGFNQQRDADRLICIRWNTQRVINNLSMHLIKLTFHLVYQPEARVRSQIRMRVCGIPRHPSNFFLLSLLLSLLVHCVYSKVHNMMCYLLWTTTATEICYWKNSVPERWTSFAIHLWCLSFFMHQKEKFMIFM